MWCRALVIFHMVCSSSGIPGTVNYWRLPGLVNVNRKLWKITMFDGKIIYKWPHNYGKSPCLMGKLTSFRLGHFQWLCNSHCQRVHPIKSHEPPINIHSTPNYQRRTKHCGFCSSACIFKDFSLIQLKGF